jgi:hypothetical protein
MRIFVFASERHKGLHAFAGDGGGSRLPARVGPWRLLFGSAPGASLPHGIGRPAIERAIVAEGFQLWRLKSPSPEGDRSSAPSEASGK